MLSGYGAGRCYSSGTPPSSPVRATKSPHLQRIYLPRVVPDAATALVTEHRCSERLVAALRQTLRRAFQNGRPSWPPDG